MLVMFCALALMAFACQKEGATRHETTSFHASIIAVSLMTAACTTTVVARPPRPGPCSSKGAGLRRRAGCGVDRAALGAPRVPPRLDRRLLALLSDFPAAAEQRHGRASGSSVARRALDAGFDDGALFDHAPGDSAQRNFRAPLP